MKILISPNFGAGWSTWQTTPQQAKFALTYQPLITALDKDTNLTNEERELSFKNALRLFEHDFTRLFDETPYIMTHLDLIVVEVEGKFRISEYDGAESVVLFNEENYYDSNE